MSLPYNYSSVDQSSYHFVTEQGHDYLIYFTESKLSDVENNQHTIYNIGFSRNDEHANELFTIKYDDRIRATIVYILDSYFKLNDHHTLLYFCFGDDGLARHRNIVFNRWHRYLNTDVEKHDNKIYVDNEIIYGSLMIVRDNPLKHLVLDAFNTYLKEITNKD